MVSSNRRGGGSRGKYRVCPATGSGSSGGITGLPKAEHHIHPTPGTFGIEIRNMALRDIQFIAEIDRQAFGRCSATEQMLAEISKMRDYQVRVALIDGITPVGYCAIGMYQDAYEITRMAVLPTLQRRGVGGILLDDLKARLHGQKKNRRKLIVVGVPEEDLATQLFFRACGFRCNGEIPCQMCEEDHSLLVMEFNVLGWVRERRELLKGGEEAGGA